MKLVMIAALLPALSIGAGLEPLEDQTTSGSWQVQVQRDRILSKTEARALGAWGAELKSPVTCLSDFTVRSKRRMIPIASRFYWDLCEVNSLFLVEDGKTLTVVISGSDASDGYRAKLSFVNGRLVSRTIEVYGVVIERTTLRTVVLN